MTQKTSLSVLLFLLFAFSMQAQSYKKLRAEGDVFFKDQFFGLAAERYEACFRKNPTNPIVNLKLGISYLRLNRMSEAEDVLQTVYEFSKDELPESIYYLGILHHRKQEFRKAAQLYKEILKVDAFPDRERSIKDKILRCESGYLQKWTSPIATLETFKEPINSVDNEKRPVISPTVPNRLYFSSNRLGAIGGLRNDQGQADAKHGHRKEDMFHVDTYSSEIKRLSELLNTSLVDEVIGFKMDGLTMYYSKGYTDDAGILYMDHYNNSNEERIAAEPMNGPFDMKQGDRDPYFFFDTLVIFSSRRLGGYGGFDLFLSEKTPTGWSEPKNLGPQINSNYDEVAPFMTNNKSAIYFSSNRTESIGKFDIFKSEFNEFGASWGQPSNMGIPINSADDDLYFSIAPNGWNFYLSSDRPEAIGQSDIFGGQFYKQQADHLSLALAQEQKVEKKIIQQSTINFSIDLIKRMEGFSIPQLYEQLLFLIEDDSLLDEVSALDTMSVIFHITEVSNSIDTFFFSQNNMLPVTDYFLEHYPNLLLYLSYELRSPNEFSQPTNYLDIYLSNNQSNKSIEPTEGLPKLSENLRYKIELPDNLNPYFEEENKYALSKEFWHGDQGRVHKMYGQFLTYTTASQWKKELLDLGIPAIKVVPYLGGRPIDIVPEKEMLDNFPDLLDYLNEDGASSQR